MSREIKFRAWGHPTKKMLGDKIKSNMNYHYWIPREMIPEKMEGGYDCSGVRLEEIFTDDNWIWMQYTGLKDRNGKEIYEGDIVTWIRTEPPNITHAIKWFDKDACFGSGGLPLEVIFQSGFYQPEFGESRLEIIGNIHENPNLLENNS